MDDLPLTLTIEEAGQVLQVGRNTAYDLVRSGQLRSIKVGKQIRIPKQAMLEYLGQFD
ncbi:helix-turn-helix domain-containing protein [Dysosmobacter sp.]